MKVCLLFLLAASSLPAALPFTTTRTTSLIKKSCSAGACFRTCRRRTRLNSENNDIDDFYSDYDPSEFSQFQSDAGGEEHVWRSSRRSSAFSRPHRNRNGHGYERDTSRDSSNVDEDAVNRLLSERVQARKSQDFESADKIRDQLLSDYAVAVNDRKRVWRTGCSASGSGLSGAFKQSGSGQRRQSWQAGKQGRRRNIDFGPNGHDYELCSDAGANTSSLAEEEIHEMLAERLKAKISRNFDTADRIQCDLIDEGVYVNDVSKEWRADGVPFDDIKNQNDGNRRRQGGSAYTKSPYSEDPGDKENLFSKLVMERAKYKIAGEYWKADSIRDGLLDKFNVCIDDRIKEWSLGGNFGDEHNKNREMSQAMSSRGYVKSTDSVNLPSVEDEKYVQTKIDERCEAKKSRDYDLADEIRDDLRAEFGVIINDKLKQWSVGGNFGSDGRVRSGGEYRQRGGGNLSEDEVNNINSLCIERFQAKLDRNYESADEIRNHLLDTYNVVLDDKTREWRVDQEDYVQVASTTGASDLAEDDVETVQDMLKKRASLKKQGKYDEADEIWQDLFIKFGVKVDDRTKEWRVDVARKGYTNDKPTDQPFSIDEELDDMFESLLDEADDIDTEEEEDDSKKLSLDPYGSKTQSMNQENDGMFDSIFNISENNELDNNSDGDGNSSLINDELDSIFDSILSQEDDPTVVNIDDKNTSIYTEDTEEERDAIERSTILDFDGFQDEQDTDGLIVQDSHKKVEMNNELSKDFLSSLTVAQLKEKLRDAGKPVSGKKAVLIDRLLE